MATVNILVENVVKGSEMETVLLENITVDMDKLMALLTGKPMPRKRTPRKPKVETASVEVKVETPKPVEAVQPNPVEKPVETPKPTASKPRKGGFRRRKASHNKLRVPLTECIAIAEYPTRFGMKPVAQYRKPSNGVIVLLWIEDNGDFASHDDGGFIGAAEKLANVHTL